MNVLFIGRNKTRNVFLNIYNSWKENVCVCVYVYVCVCVCVCVCVRVHLSRTWTPCSRCGRSRSSGSSTGTSGRWAASAPWRRRAWRAPPRPSSRRLPSSAASSRPVTHTHTHTHTHTLMHIHTYPVVHTHTHSHSQI